MRTMKDKERLFIIIKVFLHLNGPATAKEIVEYLQICPVKIQKPLHPNTLGSLFRGNPQKIKAIKNTRPKKYMVIE